MNILILTYSVTRTAGGVFDAVRDLFVNSAFKKHQLKIFSFIDENIDKDRHSWKGIPMKLFKPLPMLYSHKIRKALLKESPDIFHMVALSSTFDGDMEET